MRTLRQHRAGPSRTESAARPALPSTPPPGAQGAGRAQAPSALRGAGGTDLQAARAFRKRSEDPGSCISSGNLGADTYRAAAVAVSSDALPHGREPGLSGLRGTRSQSSACRCQGLWLSSRWVNLPSGNLPVCPVPTCSARGGGASGNGAAPEPPRGARPPRRCPAPLGAPGSRAPRCGAFSLGGRREPPDD